MIVKVDTTHKTIRVACYCRVSTQEQVQHGVSLAEQQERLKAHAAMEHWDIINFYIDEGFSGKDGNRPQLQNLILDANAGRFDLVIVTKIDSLMRNVRLLLNLIDIFKQSGVSIVAQADVIDTVNIETAI